MSVAATDLVGAELFRRSLQNLVREMAITLVRTSGSPVVTDAQDLSTALMDRDGELLAFSANVAFHVASSYLGVQAVRAAVDPDDLGPGDAFVCNDPHTSGAIHQADVGVVMPLFHDDVHVAWAFANAHVLDIGGFAPNGMAPTVHDAFGEGLRFPGSRIMRRGFLDEEWLRFVETNVRVPTLVVNDLRSLIASCNTAQTRLDQIVGEVGVDRMRELSEQNKDLSERALRDKIAKLPSGAYHARDWQEFDGHGEQELHEVRCRLDVDGDRMTFRFSGAPQTESFINAGNPALRGQVLSSVLCSLAYDVPVNAGLWRAVEVDLGDPGSVVNPLPPAPVSGGHMEIGTRSGKVALAALNQALALSEDPVLRGRVSGQPLNASANAIGSGQTASGDPVVAFLVDSYPGGGAQTTGDGQDAYAFQTMVGCSFPDVEVHESAYPLLYLYRSLNENSGGPGAFRGGQGTDIAYVPYGARNYRLTILTGATELPPRGHAGGYPGGTSAVDLVRDSGVQASLERGAVPTRQDVLAAASEMPAKASGVKVGADDIVRYYQGGGGGLGDPLHRPVALVERDVCDGYLTAAHAETAYGVVLGPSGVDEQATDERRRRIRTDRLGSDPAREARPGVTASVPIKQDGDSLACSHCDAPLGPGPDGWRELAQRSEHDLVEAAEALGMHVRGRPSPLTLLHRYACPGCGYLIATDVVLASEDDPLVFRAPIA